MDANVTIYHNPRCSKSRQTLQLLRDRGIEPEIIEYLKTPPDETALARILGQLGISAHELTRTGESLYKELGLDKTSPNDAQMLRLLVENPKLIERPIVVTPQGAAIGRPPENVLRLL